MFAKLVCAFIMGMLLGSLWIAYALTKEEHVLGTAITLSIVEFFLIGCSIEEHWNDK